MPATYDVRVDWNDDSDYSDTGENVTTRFLLRSAAKIEYGRDQVRSLAPPASGKLTFELNNESRDYSPENSSSPLAGNLGPGRQVRMQATVTPTTYTLFQGFLDDYEVLPNLEDRSVKFTALDALAKLRGVTISTDLHQGIRTGEAIGYILDAAGWPAADRDLDSGATYIRWWWEEGTDAFAAVERVLNSEGIPALVTVDVDGNFVFRDRHHRLTRAASITLQATFRDTGTEPVMTAPLEYDHGWRDIINSVTFSVAERDPAPELSAVWTASGVISIADGETVPLRVEVSDPFIGAIMPEAGTDYTLLSGAVTITLSRTQGASATIFITANGGPATIDALQLRAYPLVVRRTVQIHAEDSTSISKHGRRSLPSEAGAPWAGVHDAAALADIVLAHRAERLPVVRVRLVSANDTRLAQMLGRDLSDRVTIIDAETGLNGEFFIERIEHEVSEGLVHSTVFGCEAVAELPSNLFTFDVAGKGFNDGVFGLGGLSDPDSLFRFDTAGQGFNQGLLAY